MAETAIGLWAMIGKVGLVSLVSRFGAGAPELPNVSDLHEARALSWPQVERLVGDIFRRRGFAVSPVTATSEGVDLVLRKDDQRLFVSCRQWSVWDVGAKAVHQLFIGMRREGVTGGIMVTTGQFTEEASDFASATGLELVDGSALLELVEEAQQAA